MPDQDSISKLNVSAISVTKVATAMRRMISQDSEVVILDAVASVEKRVNRSSRFTNTNKENKAERTNPLPAQSRNFDGHSNP